MAQIQVTHDVHFGKNFCRNLFCDARLTKDGVALIPVHKIILSSFSPKFKKIFESEDQKDGMTFVPIVDFPNLKKVVAFIYDGRITLNSKEELCNFLDALNYLKVTVDHQVTDMKPEVDSSYIGGLKEIQGVPLIGLAQGGMGRESRMRRTSRKFVEKAFGKQRSGEGASLRSRGEQTWSLSEGSLNSNESETGKSDDDEGDKGDEWREREQRRERLMGRLGPLFGRDKERSGLASLSKDDLRNKITKTDLRHRIKKQ